MLPKTSEIPTEQAQAQNPQEIDLSDKNKALMVLINAVKLAQGKGVYSLEEAEIISRAIRAFVIPAPAGPVAVS